MSARKGGRRPGAGRPKGSKNKTTIAKEVVAEILDVDSSQTLEAAVHKRGHTLLMEMERIVTDPTQPIGARIMAAKVALPFLLPRRETLSAEAGFTPDLIARMEEGRRRCSERRLTSDG